MAFLKQNMNQFAQTPILGAVDMIPSPSVITAQVNPASALTSLQAGDPVKLLTGASGAIFVDKQTGPTDVLMLGVIPYNERINLYAAGAIVEVVTDGVVYMLSGAAVVRGTNVAITVSTTTTDPTVATDVTSTHIIVGQALDEAGAAGVLIRVKVAPAKLP
jgi:hypothetical protein